jgi:hypothetical protein
MDEREQQDQPDVDQEAMRDLDVDQEDADKVLGGGRGAGDPCDGGEATGP